MKEKQYLGSLSGAQDERKGKVRSVLQYLQLKYIGNLIFFLAGFHLLPDRLPRFLQTIYRI